MVVRVGGHQRRVQVRPKVEGGGPDCQERACQAQIAAMAGGAKLVMPSKEIAEKVAAQFERPGYQEKKGEWRALLRALDKTDPSYKN